MILHVDMDAFYASVEERENPRLMGKPVVVGGSAEGRGVVAAANYEARKYGVHSAMPAAVAKNLCPNAVFLPSRIDFYSTVSADIRAIFERYTPQIEPLSLDEAFLDVRASQKLFGTPVDIARQIKRDIAEELRLVASVGVAVNKFIAKLASDLDKPDGLVVVRPGEEQAFLDPLPVGCIWGIGRASGAIFKRIGVETIADLRGLRSEVLVGHFGRHGEHLWDLAHGRDDRAVVTDYDAKSISHEITFAKDVTDEGTLRAWMLDLTEQVGRRLRRLEREARTVQIKVRYSDFHTVTRARSFTQSTDTTATLWKIAAELLHQCLVEDPRPVRLIGMGATGLGKPEFVQSDMFDGAVSQKQSKIDTVVDSIVEIGSATVLFGELVTHAHEARR